MWTSATLSSPGTSGAALPLLEGRPRLLVTALDGWLCGGEVLHGLFWDHITLIPGDILFQTHDNSFAQMLSDFRRPPNLTDTKGKIKTQKQNYIASLLQIPLSGLAQALSLMSWFRMYYQ